MTDSERQIRTQYKQYCEKGYEDNDAVLMLTRRFRISWEVVVLILCKEDDE